MAGPGALLLLGGLLGGLPPVWGGPGGALGGPESPAELEEEVSIVQRSEPLPPHCFSRTLHDLSCFWDSPGDPDPQRFRLQFRLEQDPWQDCSLLAVRLPPGGGSRFRFRSRFWCFLPAAATVTFVPLELRVLPGTPPKTAGTPETTGTPLGTPPGTTGTTGTPPKTAGTPETTGTPLGTPPGTPGTTGTPPKTAGTTETTGTTQSPPGTPRTPPGTTEITGTTESPPGTTGTPESPPGTPPKTAGTTEIPPGTTGTPPGTPPGTPGPPHKEPEPPPPLFQRTIYIDQVVLPGPPQNVSVTPGGARGELCVRWAPPPGPYLHSSLVFELALSPPGGPPKTVGVPAGRREQGVGGLRGSTAYSVRVRARPDGLSYGGWWSPWSPPGTARTPPDLDGVTLGLSSLLVLLLLGLGVLGLLGHRRTLQAKLWPPVPGPEREFEGLFSSYGGNFQLWLCQSSGSPCAPPAPPPLEAEDSVEEVGEGPGAPPALAPPPAAPQTPPPARGPPAGPSPSPSFEYTLFEPGSALLRPSPYANLAPPPKGPAPKWEEHAPNYVICS